MFKPKVLFVCTGNSCRSQIAEGILRDKAGDKFDVFSAGSHPSRVNPMSIRVMNEWEIDISHHTSDPIDYYLDKGIDIVITVCDNANQVCPTFPGDAKRLHWSIKDPFAGWDADDEYLDSFRKHVKLFARVLKNFYTAGKLISQKAVNSPDLII